MPFSNLGLAMPQFQISNDLMDLPGLPHHQEAEIARHRERQIARRRLAASVFQQTAGAATRQSFTRAGERPIEGTFETPQELPDRIELPNFNESFNLFLSNLGF